MIENNIITITKDTLDHEHICCAISSKSTLTGVAAKKEWMYSRIEEGFRFKKLDARGKVFIEYIPAENAWMPIDAKGYMHINCFWVSGSYRGKGYGKQLLSACEQDARESGCVGITVVVGKSKKPFLSDKKYLLKHGFEVCDSCSPYFELLVKRFDKITPLPSFKPSARRGMGEGIKGIDIFYTAQCPFTIPYTEMLNSVILANEIPVRLHWIKTKEMAQEHVCPITTYSLFVDGIYYTNEIQTPEKLQKLIDRLLL